MLEAPAVAAPVFGAGDRSVVEVVPPREARPLDPSADPTTALGELRARYLPVWSPDLDWAFPPETCGSDWALDAVAEPTASANLGVLDDPMAAAALSVMRYEYLLSRAFTAPDPLGQVCVAVATVGAVRSDALHLLATHLAAGTRATGAAVRPDEVRIVAAGPTGVLVVACVTPGYPETVTADPGTAAPDPGTVTADGEVLATATGLSRLQAYLLTVTRGLEDAVTDISFRVSDIQHTPAADCTELAAWTAEWEHQAEQWAATGQIWTQVARTVTTEELCTAPPPTDRKNVTVTTDCPRDWSP